MPSPQQFIMVRKQAAARKSPQEDRDNGAPVKDQENVQTL